MKNPKTGEIVSNSIIADTFSNYYESLYLLKLGSIGRSSTPDYLSPTFPFF